MTGIIDKVGSLKAQDPIYLGEDRHEAPKELFKTMASIIDAAGHRPGSSLIDVGCATGEAITYLIRRFPDFGSFCGVDISPAMISRATERVSGASFVTADIALPSAFSDMGQFDVVWCSGVLSCFDDPTVPLSNLFGLAKPGGSVIVAAMINEHPVDAVIRYRRTDSEDGIWETGWNLFSRGTIERLLSQLPYRLSLVWTKFDMPFSIPKTADPMRTWTIATENNPFQTVNGISQLVNPWIVHARVDALAGGRQSAI